VSPRAACTWLALCAAVSGIGCDGLGRPLVGKKDSEGLKGQVGLCVLAPSCEDDREDDLAAEILPMDSASVQLAACGAELRECQAFRDDLGTLTHRGCLTAWPVHATAASVDDSVFDCTSITLANTDEDIERIETRGVELQRSNVSISSTTPLLVQLEGALIDDVTFLLTGPVTLRIARTRALRHVRVVGSGHLEGGEQRLEISRVDGEDLSVSSDYGVFTGTVVLEQGALENARVSALSIETVDMALTRATLESTTLSATRSNLELAMLTFEDGHLRGSTVDRAQVTRCTSLAVSTGYASHVRFPSCAEPLRIYGARIEKSFVDGAIEADLAQFESVVFGVHEQTDLLAWDTKIFTSNFCKHARTTRLTASVHVICPSCAPEGNMIACADSNGIRDIKVSDCFAFEEPDECGGAIPERPLPP
jgi:hypothetical protein